MKSVRSFGAAKKEFGFRFYELASATNPLGVRIASGILHPLANMKQSMVHVVLANNEIGISVISAIAVDMMNACPVREFVTQSSFSYLDVSSKIFGSRQRVPKRVIALFGAKLTVKAEREYFSGAADLTCDRNCSSHAIHPPLMNVWSGLLGSSNFSASRTHFNMRPI